MICVCGRLMTGLHMRGCRRLNKIRVKLLAVKQTPTQRINEYNSLRIQNKLH